MPSETTIANLALAHLGQNQIMSLADESQLARFCAVYYPQVRDEELQQAFWSFAIARASLTRLSDDPLYEWSAQYQLPSDYIRVHQFNGWWWCQSASNFQIEGSALLCNSTDRAQLRYVRRVTDCTLFHPLFVKCLAFALASQLAKAVNGDVSLAQNMAAAAAQVRAQAEKANAYESHPPLRPGFMQSQLVNARVNGRGYYGDGLYWEGQ